MELRRRDIRSIMALLLGIPLFLYLDSPYFASYSAYGQDISTFLVFIAFAYLYKKNTPRYRRFMIIGIFIGFTGEILFSLILHMYHYRLENIPLWVGFGHSLIFASVHRIIRMPYIVKHKQEILQKLIIFIVFYSFAWLYFAQDVFGFITTILFLILLYIQKKSRLFFTIMFLIVCYIEIIGTSTMTWYWPDILMGKYEMITSANPPSGIALFYFLFDYAVLHIYFILYPQLKRRYKKGA